MTTARETLREEFKDPEARHDYAQIFGDSSIALQIKALRLQRGLTQGDLASLTEMKQSRISAMEQASYSGWSIRTLRRLARAFDVVLVVRFEGFGRFLDDVTVDKRRESLERPSFDHDPGVASRRERITATGVGKPISAGTSTSLRLTTTTTTEVHTFTQQQAAMALSGYDAQPLISEGSSSLRPALIAAVGLRASHEITLGGDVL